MKLKLLFIICLFCTIKSFSQAYQPFQFGNSRWKYLEYTNPFNPQYSFTYIYSVDTNGFYFNGERYWKLETSDNSIYDTSSVFSYKRYFLDDTINKKVYMYSQTTQTKELVYDFSANIGDTIINVYNDFTVPLLDTVFIDSIKYLNINSIVRKHIYSHCIANASWATPFAILWIEGLGSNIYLSMPTFQAAGYDLVCQEYDGNINYGSQKICDSLLPTYINNPIYKNNISITIYPNPSNNGIFYIKTTEKITWQLSNLEGKIISQGTQNNIDISNQPIGIYILQIKTNNNLQTIKLQKL